jgi:copper chaperone CopZ
MSTSINARETAKSILPIASPRCSFCSRVIEGKLVKMLGIKEVAVSYLTDTVLVRYDPEKTTTGMIRESIKKLGYDTVERHYK